MGRRVVECYELVIPNEFVDRALILSFWWKQRFQRVLRAALHHGLRDFEHRVITEPLAAPPRALRRKLTTTTKLTGRPFRRVNPKGLTRRRDS